MNWFDSSELSKLATKTLKNAQKTIDRVLDIDEAAAAIAAQETQLSASNSQSSLPSSSSQNVKEPQSDSSENTFWNTWLTPPPVVASHTSTHDSPSAENASSPRQRSSSTTSSVASDSPTKAYSSKEERMRRTKERLGMKGKRSGAAGSMARKAIDFSASSNARDSCDTPPPGGSTSTVVVVDAPPSNSNLSTDSTAMPTCKTTPMTSSDIGADHVTLDSAIMRGEHRECAADAVSQPGTEESPGGEVRNDNSKHLNFENKSSPETDSFTQPHLSSDSLSQPMTSECLVASPTASAPTTTTTRAAANTIIASTHPTTTPATSIVGEDSCSGHWSTSVSESFERLDSDTDIPECSTVERDCEGVVEMQVTTGDGDCDNKVSLHLTGVHEVGEEEEEEGGGEVTCSNSHSFSVVQGMKVSTAAAVHDDLIAADVTGNDEFKPTAIESISDDLERITSVDKDIKVTDSKNSASDAFNDEHARTLSKDCDLEMNASDLTPPDVSNVAIDDDNVGPTFIDDESSCQQESMPSTSPDLCPSSPTAPSTPHFNQHTPSNTPTLANVTSDTNNEECPSVLVDTKIDSPSHDGNESDPYVDQIPAPLVELDTSIADESSAIQAVDPSRDDLDTSAAGGQLTVDPESDLGKQEDNGPPVVQSESSSTLVDDSSSSCGGGTATDQEVGVVNNLLEEAMAESMKISQDIMRDGPSPSSTSSTESAEIVRLETSSDIDTTTSSDIEVITGQGLLDMPKYTSRQNSAPFTHDTQEFNIQYKRIPGKRTVSESTSSNQELGFRHRRNSSSESNEIYKETRPRHDSKKSEKDSSAMDAMIKIPRNDHLKAQSLSEIIQAREHSLLAMSKENCSLTDENIQLTKEIENLQVENSTSVESMNLEFNSVVSEMQMHIDTITKERDDYKKKIWEYEAATLKGSNAESLLADKQNQIDELLMEGEKLSKQMHTYSQNMKKLRAKEKQNNTSITTLNTQIDSLKEEILKLKSTISDQSEIEISQRASLKSLNETVDMQEKELYILRGDTDNNQEKFRTMQANLDSSYRELSELQKEGVEREKRFSEIQLSYEMKTKEQVRYAVEEANTESSARCQRLMSTVEALKAADVRRAADAELRDSLTRKDIQDMQTRLQEADDRNQSITENFSTATKPLLRQIENLQNQIASQTTSYEAIERSLTDRLNEAQIQLATSLDRERRGNDRVVEVAARFSSLESRLNAQQKELATSHALLRTAEERANDTRDRHARELEKHEKEKNKLSFEINDIKKSLILLESELEISNSKVESSHKKLLVSQDLLKDKESQLQKHLATPTSKHSRHSSITSEISQEDVSQTSYSSPLSKYNLYESMQGHGANLMENLQTTLKLREGEIIQLHANISDLEKTRTSMSNELVILVTANEKLEENTEKYKSLTLEFKALTKRYNALLQMYGEKVEDYNELSLDLKDVKELYKSQIQELMEKQ